MKVTMVKMGIKLIVDMFSFFVNKYDVCTHTKDTVYAQTVLYPTCAILTAQEMFNRSRS